MPKPNKENHLNVYRDRSELHLATAPSVLVFPEGPQDEATKKRYAKIVSAFESGFLDKVYAESATGRHDLSKLPADVRIHLSNIAASISASVGRALAGLVFLQLAVKAISPKQSVRLHKGGSSRSDFSWRQGVSLRSLDKSFTAPFLRDRHLLELNRDGVMMTRTLAENYPYTQLYKARITGPSDDWMALVDGMESNGFDPLLALSFLMAAFKNRSEQFRRLADETTALADSVSSGIDLAGTTKLLTDFVAKTDYSARAFEVVMHALFQAMRDIGKLDASLAPLAQMRSANKKAGNIGDVELLDSSGLILESWDAKFGKAYLWDELEELAEKLRAQSQVRVAGFVTNVRPNTPNDLLNRKNQIATESGTEIEILSFADWVRFKCGDLSDTERKRIPKAWLTAVAESFGRKRLDIAPIDEPCDKWLSDYSAKLKEVSGR